MTADARVAIVGLGLLGGSLGLALDGSVAARVGVVVEGDEQTRRRALERNAVDEVWGIERAVGEADIVVLAVPAAEAVRLVPEVARSMRGGALLTDLSSTKRAIVSAMREVAGPVRCVGGHPMCGDTSSGIEAARAELFNGCRWVLCNVDEDDGTALEDARGLVHATGASAVDMSADAHDAAASYASHLPYATAQALAHVVLEAQDQQPGVRELAARGLAGATRMAAGDLRMWSDVLRTNRDFVDGSLAALAQQIEELRLRLDDPAALDAWLESGARWRRSWSV